MSLLWAVTLLIVGACFGSMLADLRWQLNSANPGLVKIGRRYFKVVKPDLDLSWDLADTYRTTLYTKEENSGQ